MPPKDKLIRTNRNESRRKFLHGSIKLAALSSILYPFQKVFGKDFNFDKHLQQPLSLLINPVPENKLFINTKTQIAHLPTLKIFTNYPDIAEKNQKMLDLKTWETVVKGPVHFNKEKSGIMLEVLALQKLDTGINNHNLAAAANTLAMAFTETYKASDGSIINKFNFRLHDLLLQTITLNDSIPSFQKWERFQSTTGKIYYNEADRLPKRMKWLMTEQDFNKQVNYILDNKTKYEERLKQRAENFKL